MNIHSDNAYNMKTFGYPSENQRIEFVILHGVELSIVPNHMTGENHLMNFCKKCEI